MAQEAYASGLNLDQLMVNTKAATIYTAQENSLYLSGGIVPIIKVGPGSITAQVPVMGSVAAQVLTSEAGTGVDLETRLPTDATNTVTLDLHAARTVLRDLGGIDPQEMGRILGDSVAKSVDHAVTAAMATLTAQEITDGDGTLDINEIFNAVATIRGTGEQGELFGIISTDAYASLMTSLGSAAFAGGDFQTAAMRNGFFGRIAGVTCFVSSYVNNTVMGITTNPKMAIFSKDALRGATSGGVKVEIGRRPAAVGYDVVASSAFGAGIINVNAGVLIVNNA